jgi:hypothetical protein
MKQKYEYVPTHLVGDGLTSIIVRVQVEELSIILVVIFRGLRREVDGRPNRLKDKDLGKVS